RYWLRNRPWAITLYDPMGDARLTIPFPGNVEARLIGYDGERLLLHSHGHVIVLDRTGHPRHKLLSASQVVGADGTPFVRIDRGELWFLSGMRVRGFALPDEKVAPPPPSISRLY